MQMIRKLLVGVLGIAGFLLAMVMLAGPASAEVDPQAARDEFVARINSLRTSKGLNALVVDNDLNAIAQDWSQQMANAGAISHRPNLADVAPSDWTRLGENVGVGPSVASLDAAFIASPGHYANLVNTGFRQVGLGVVVVGSKIYVTENFMTAPLRQVAASSAPGGQGGSGYWMVGTDGVVYAFGGAQQLGNAPVGRATAEDLEPTPSGRGYWVVSSAGNVFTFGDAVQLGGIDGALNFGEKVTSISALPSGRGYWLFTTFGRVVAFGEAPFLGDMSGTRLNGAVLDSIPTPSGDGYYMVAGDGGIFTFGDAAFHGSMGGTKLNAPVQSLVPDGDGDGYWLVSSDGGIFAFEAPFYGSMGATRLNRPITGMVASGPGGYLMVGEDGGIFTFGSADFRGSLGDRPPARPITSVAVLAV